ncbi:amidohydrolase family protein [Mycobacterium sp. NPDC006124]|uniref:amidohydrolase family protein n=1 Tax=Mycobacterium sp. NPDC006124 TaxID=3156729 RepID=UPI0033B53602
MPEHERPALIDVHAHFVTDDYVSAARAAGIDQPDGMPMWPSWSVDEQLRSMRDKQIGHAVLSLSSPGVTFAGEAASPLAREMNVFAATAVAEHPRRFSYFATLPLPDVDAAVSEATHTAARGAVGVVVMSNSGGQYLGDAALDPLWERLNALRSLVFVHPTSPPDAESVALDRPRPVVEFMFETTRTITDLIFAGVLARYPDIRFVIPHCGATLPLLAARIELFRSVWPGPGGEPPGPLTTSDQLQRMWFDLAGHPLPTHAAVLRDVVGAGRILYGSDSCWTPDFAVGKQIASLDDDPTVDWRGVTYENAVGLIPHIADPV